MQRNQQERNTWKRVPSIILGFVECLCFGVIIIGWPNLAFVYTNSGLFSNLCSGNFTGNATGSCTAVDNIFNLYFSIVTGLNLAAALPVGLLFDRYGLWITRLSGT